MKVVLASPDFHQLRGNTVTVKRISAGLTKRGFKTEIISTTGNDDVSILPNGDIVHGFHAYKFCMFIKRLDGKVNPYVVTITGTDINHDLYNTEKRQDVLTCLRLARAIHVFEDQAKETLLKEEPGLASKIYVIPQANSAFPNSNTSLTKEKDSFLFVLPAGLRKVKNIPQAIHMVKQLHEKYPLIRLWLVGPIIEEDEGKVIKDLIAENSDWITYHGQRPHEEMGAILQQADVVLNTSHSEGQPAALLEAMGFGVPVLVSNNKGNRSIVCHGKTGFVYDSEIEFFKYAERLIADDMLRKQIGEKAQQYVETYHSEEYEVEKMIEMYTNALKDKEDGGIF